jgi:hypothetical protein
MTVKKGGLFWWAFLGYKNELEKCRSPDTLSHHFAAL